MAEFVQASHMLWSRRGARGFIDITEELRGWLGSLSAEAGLLTVFVRHTSASLTIQENADPNVLRDLRGGVRRDWRRRTRRLPSREEGSGRHAEPYQGRC